MGTKLKRSEMNWQKCVCHYRNYSMRESPNKGSFFLRLKYNPLYEKPTFGKEKKEYGRNENQLKILEELDC